MAKIDVSKISGYADMTPEQKLAALEEFDIPDPDYSGFVKKDQYDKTASEAAEWKRKHNALLSEEERKKAESDEELTKIQNELAALKKEKQVSEHKAEFMALGYDDALATETAKALADGDLAKVFGNQKKFLENHDKSIKAEVMKGTSTPPAGGASGSVDYDKAIADAFARGDTVTAAALMRKQQEEISKK